MIDQVVAELCRAPLHQFGNAIENLPAHHGGAGGPWLGGDACNTNRLAQIFARTAGNVGDATLRELDLAAATRFTARECATDVELGGAAHLKTIGALCWLNRQREVELLGALRLLPHD